MNTFRQTMIRKVDFDYKEYICCVRNRTFRNKCHQTLEKMYETSRWTFHSRRHRIIRMTLKAFIV